MRIRGKTTIEADDEPRHEAHGAGQTFCRPHPHSGRQGLPSTSERIACNHRRGDSICDGVTRSLCRIFGLSPNPVRNQGCPAGSLEFRGGPRSAEYPQPRSMVTGWLLTRKGPYIRAFRPGSRTIPEPGTNSEQTRDQPPFRDQPGTDPR